MTERDPRLEQFDILVGTWDTESRHRLVEEVVHGTVTFEWLEGGHFLVQRSHTEDERFPDALCVLGADVAEWFDSRGVRRTYLVSVEDGVWRMWRDQPGFDQRMTATLAPGTFELVAELAERPGEWVRDMTTTYRRRG
jgi:hypothetical protein